MEKYIDLLRVIIKNFNIDNNEFDDIIKRILITLFDDYYTNRNKYIWCIDNLYKKYDISIHNFIKKKYRVVKNENLIFRFNRYNKKSYIMKLLKENPFIDKNYKSIVDNILKTKGTKNYRKYIDHTFVEKKFCFYPLCMNYVINNNYCNLHNKDMI